MRKIALALSFIATPTLVFSETTDFARCHNIPGENVRLMCYDQITGYVPKKSDESKQTESSSLAASQITKPNGSQWRYSEETSALDNRKDVWLSVKSNNTEGNSIGTPIYATLWVRCMENKTNVLIGFDRYTTDNQNVRYKFDDGAVQKQWMETMRGGDGIGIWSGSRAIPFIKRMLDKDKLIIAYDTYTGPVEFAFNISGLRERLQPLANECEWSF